MWGFALLCDGFWFSLLLIAHVLICAQIISSQKLPQRLMLMFSFIGILAVSLILTLIACHTLGVPPLKELLFFK